MQQQTQPQPETERVFDESGNVVEENVIEAPADEAPDEVAEEAPAPAASASGGTHKYRIGDKTFATQAEALAYAESVEQQTSEVDAYRQVLREAIAQTPRAPAPEETSHSNELNAEEIYTDPQTFLKRFEAKIKTETLAQVNQQQALIDQDNRVWREFTERHPDLADFREDITALASRIAPEVGSIARGKGQAAAYDYVATKFKAQVERLSSAIRPKRELRNTVQASAGASGGQNVTPKAPPKKALSFSEQIRQMKKGRQ